MLDYSQELTRRVAQFTSYLKKMHARTHVEVQGSCFMIFNEQLDRGDGDVHRWSAALSPAVELILAGFEDAGIDTITSSGEEYPEASPEDGWRDDDSQGRFIQFSFERNWFCVDMPLQTLHRAEAEQILRCRRGFFYLRDRPEFTLYGESVEGYDPFRKIYLYGDEEDAAQDMAFIFFQVWRFPVDWRFYVMAAAFGDTPTHWESGTPIL